MRPGSTFGVPEDLEVGGLVVAGVWDPEGKGVTGGVVVIPVVGMIGLVTITVAASMFSVRGAALLAE
jgi:hypothetical protein